MKDWLQRLPSRLEGAWTAIKPWLPSAEGWAAIAAVAAAFAAIMSFVQQRDSARDAIRPELILTGWTLEQGDSRPYFDVRFSTIENIGAGAAFDVTIARREVDKDDPFNKALIPSPYFIEVLRPNSPLPSHQRLLLKRPEGRTIEFFDVVLYYSDRRNTRYVTTYSMVANWTPGAIGVSVGSRKTEEL